MCVQCLSKRGRQWTCFLIHMHDAHSAMLYTNLKVHGYTIHGPTWLCPADLPCVHETHEHTLQM